MFILVSLTTNDNIVICNMLETGVVDFEVKRQLGKAGEFYREIFSVLKVQTP